MPNYSSRRKIVVIGAGIGGLTAGAILAKAGHLVTLLEAHVYPGGCAGTFYHKGYRFDAGATLAGGFYSGGPMNIVANLLDIDSWPLLSEDRRMPAMTVHLPDGTQVNRFGSEERWLERTRVFGAESVDFFRWQERNADLLWDLAMRTLPWPPQGFRETRELVFNGCRWFTENLLAIAGNIFPLILDARGKVESHLQDQPENLRLFIDAQLLIASQATSQGTNALYGASALDLPRRGIVHLNGGIGAIAETIADAFKSHGGNLLYREEVSQIQMHDGFPLSVTIKRGKKFDADIVIANLPPWNIKKLIESDDNFTLAPLPPKLKSLEKSPTKGGGAFMAYVGVDDSVVPPDTPLHHQVILREPLGEGNSVFLSLSPAQDKTRAPRGKRAMTLSTHTHIESWWKLFQNDKERYEMRKERYLEMLLAAAQQVMPQLKEGIALVKPGTPVTFKRFTRREWGWVGGFPQSNLFQAWGPNLAPNLWMVGDTIFPGQSTAAVALGGVRVANSILSSLGQTEFEERYTFPKHDNINLVDSAGSTSYG